MLTHTQLVALHRALRGRHVLSVYVDGAAADFALQRSWRLELEHSLGNLRRWLDGSSHDERKEFDQCVGLLNATLADFDPSVGAPGWAAFITADGIHDAQRLPAPVPTLAVWSTGPSVAPYIRALKENRPVVVVVADARKASIHRYRMGALEHQEVVRAHRGVDRAAYTGAPPHVGFHTGTHGAAGRDAAQRVLLKGRDRMIAQAVERVMDLAGADGWILLGGIKRVVARLTESLLPHAPHRVLALDTLDIHASDADVAAAARSGASALRDSVDAERITQIAELAGAHGLGAIGAEDTLYALEQSSVRDLYITHRFLENHSAHAEQAIRAALEQDAMVEEVSGAAAEQLDERGGLAAGLRFRPAAAEALVGST